MHTPRVDGLHNMGAHIDADDLGSTAGNQGSSWQPDIAKADDGNLLLLVDGHALILEIDQLPLFLKANTEDSGNDWSGWTGGAMASTAKPYAASSNPSATTPPDAMMAAIRWDASPSPNGLCARAIAL